MYLLMEFFFTGCLLKPSRVSVSWNTFWVMLSYELKYKIAWNMKPLETWPPYIARHFKTTYCPTPCVLASPTSDFLPFLYTPDYFVYFPFTAYITVAIVKINEIMSIDLVSPSPVHLLTVENAKKERWDTEKVEIVGKKEWRRHIGISVYLVWRKDERKDTRKMDILGGKLTFKKLYEHFFNASYVLSLMLDAQKS